MLNRLVSYIATVKGWSIFSSAPLKTFDFPFLAPNLTPLPCYLLFPSLYFNSTYIVYDIIARNLDY